MRMMKLDYCVRAVASGAQCCGLHPAKSVQSAGSGWPRKVGQDNRSLISFFLHCNDSSHLHRRPEWLRLLPM